MFITKLIQTVSHSFMREKNVVLVAGLVILALVVDMESAMWLICCKVVSVRGWE